MDTKKIVITGGPGTGKSSIINELKQRGYICFEEISRQVTLEARKKGIEQLFLTEPILFSELLLEGRLNQFNEATIFENELIFLDRGLPDVLAYLDYYKTTYPDKFIETCQSKRYDQVFVLSPWQEIFVSDGERYENFEQAERIHNCLLNSYENFNYNLIDVPFKSVAKRANFILDALNL